MPPVDGSMRVRRVDVIRRREPGFFDIWIEELGVSLSVPVTNVAGIQIQHGSATLQVVKPLRIKMSMDNGVSVHRHIWDEPYDAFSCPLEMVRGFDGLTRIE